MSSFKKPSLTILEKEKKAEEFINFTQESIVLNKSNLQDVKIIPKKEPTKAVLLRIPESFKRDIDTIISLTGLSFNSVCLELLRTSIKKKLKELHED